MINIIIIKDKVMVEELERKEDELRVFDILMKSEIDVSKCRGRE